MVLLSKELLSAVLNTDASQISLHKNMCEYYHDNGNIFEGINIYELMHLMKEWAIKHNYRINSTTYYHKNSDIVVGNSNVEKRIGKEFYSSHSNQGNYSEFEAVTKACEWILKETKC